VMMVWSDRPREEQMYLGENVRQVDVWGRSTPLEMESNGVHSVHRIPVGRVPTFLVGVDPTLMAFRMAVELEPDHLDSLLGREQPILVRYANPTNRSLLGALHVEAPPSWSIRSPSRPLEMLASRSGMQEFNVELGYDATVGKYEVPLRFEFQTTPPRTITVHREIEVGPKGLKLEATTRMIGSEMLVQLEVTNSGPRTRTYQLVLFPRNERKDKRLIMSIDPGKTIKRFFALRDGEELIGQPMWLRAVEQDADQILNYTIIGTR
ncbi:MAG: hypothetical protein AAF989_10455, partial [Planctomycetota bacterium]